MKRYVHQLLTDIQIATTNVQRPFTDSDENLINWLSDEEEERTAPRIPLEDWTGIRKAQLPPQEYLDDEELEMLLSALRTMLDTYNWAFVMQITVPARIQYECIRDNFDQEAIMKSRHYGFFELCRPGTPHRGCALGAYCHCRFFKELCDGFEDEELTPEEERARMLELEVQHIKKKYGDRWQKYYPYHLDPEYDDENGNPHNYGFDLEDDVDPSDWWK